MMTKLYHWLILIGLVSNYAAAKDIPLGYQPTTFEQIDQVAPIEKSVEHKIDTAPAQAITPAQTSVSIEKDSIDQQISKAVVNKQWSQLAVLLAQYRLMPNHDQILYFYAMGALQRYRGQYAQAIDLYREIIRKQPDLVYPHFDLALMLIENQQYQEAQQELERLFPKAPSNLKPYIRHYWALLQKQQKWQPYLSLQYEQTDNVNNAPMAKEITINGRKFIRNEENLPKSAHGLAYSLGLFRQKNMGGNHFLDISAGLNGIYYWDASEYQEQSWNIAAGYRYRNAQTNWGVSPFFEYNRLGRQSYSNRYGLRMVYTYDVHAKWRISSHFTHAYRTYHQANLAKRYNGVSNHISLQTRWKPFNYLHVHIGADFGVETNKDKAESSHRYGISLGGQYEQHFGVQWHTRYGHRDFQAEHFLFGLKRQDKELGFNTAIWHRKLQWKGIQPKLNYRYRKTISNLSELYNRQDHAWFITVEQFF